MKKHLLSLILFTATLHSNAQTLNFDQPFATRSWTEDGYNWSWDNSGWDNIRTYVPHTGSGHAMTAPGYYSKLSTTTNINIQGVWLRTDFPSDFKHLKLKGFDSTGTLLYTQTLNANDYSMQYAYVTLNWNNVRSFAVDFENTDPLMGRGDVFYDDLDYTISSLGVNDNQPLLNIQLYPNPAQNFIQVTGLTSAQEYHIYAVSGTMVANGMVRNNGIIDIQKLKSGVYFIKIKDRDTLKFIKK